MLTFLVLDFRFHVLDSVRRLDFEGDCFARQGLDEDLHSTAQTQDQVQSGLLLDVVIRQGAAILELLSSEDETLLVRGDSYTIEMELLITCEIGKKTVKMITHPPCLGSWL